MKRFLLIIFLLIASNVTAAVEEQVFPDPAKFPLPDPYKPTVQFWMRVYGEWGDNQMAIHDSKNMEIVLDVIDLPDENSLLASVARPNVGKRVAEIRSLLLELHENPEAQKKSEEHKRIFELYKNIHDPNKFKNSAENLRVQQGIKDRFHKGLEQMTLYIDRIKKIFADDGLPEELAYLPLVESSFNNQSLSRTRAAGIWQFMSGTARLYMKVNWDVDERLDPFISSRGAARYLKRSYQMLGSWPVAIMSYNHGQPGMVKAVKTVGSSDFMDIVNNYKGNYFGFASRNFYGEFLAACKVMNDADEYFDEINYAKPLLDDAIKLSKPLWVSNVLNHSSLTREELRAHNPALQSSVIYSRRPMPAGYQLRFPAGRFEDVNAFIAKLRTYEGKSTTTAAKASSTSSGSAGNTYVVKRGDTLFSISRRFATTVEDLRKLNRLSRDIIIPGQKLFVSSR